MSLTQLSEQAGIAETLVKQAPYIADPLNAYQQLCKGKPNTLLLESAEIDSKDNLKSLILLDAALKLVCNEHEVSIVALNQNGASLLPLFSNHAPLGVTCTANADNTELSMVFSLPDADLDEDSRLKAPAVFDALRLIVERVRCLRDHPQNLFTGGAFAYDLLASFETLPRVENSENSCPDFVFYLAQSLLVIDHQQQSTELVSTVFSGQNVSSSYFAVSQQMEQYLARLASLDPLVEVELTDNYDNTLQVDKTDEQFKQNVVDSKL